MDSTRVSVARLSLVAAAMEMFFGLAIYGFPGEFKAPAYAPLRPFFPYFSAALVAGGVLLLLLNRYSLWPWARRVLFFLTALPLAVLSWLFGVAHVWTGLVHYGLVAMALLAIPWLSAGEDGDPTRPGLDLAALTLGPILAVNAGLMLVAPGTFATPNYASIQGVLPVAGTVGLVGGASLILRGVGLQWPALGGTAVRLAGAALPLLLVYNFLRTGIWTGVIAWGLWAAATLAGSRGARIRADVPSTERDPLLAVERMLEAWAWILALLVVLLTALAGAGAVTSPLRANLFVLAVSGYNAAVHWGLAGIGAPARRIYCHLGFLTLGIGFLLAGAGPVGHGLVALLVAAPPLATRALGPRAGYQMLALSLSVVGLGELADGVWESTPLSLALGAAALEMLVLGAAASVGMRSAAAQRRLLQEVASANAGLQRQVEMLAVIDRIGGAIRRSLDLDEILGTTVLELGRTLRVSRCFIRMRQEDELLPLAHEYAAPGVNPMGTGHSGRLPGVTLVVQTRQVVAVSDVLRDPRLDAPALGRREDLIDLAVQSGLLAPILVEGELLGVIGLHQCDAPREWTPEEISFLEAVASQVGVAVAHARAHQALAERHALLEGTYQDVQAANEELVAQQEELAAQNEELREQSETIRYQRDRLEEALESARRAKEGQEQMAAVLLESEKRFRTAFEFAPIGVSLTALDGRYLQVNRSMCEMLGFSESELLATTFQAITHPDDIRLNVEVGRQLRAGEVGVYEFEKRFLHRLGHPVPAQISVSLLRDGDGKPLHYISQIQDITERKRFEFELVHLANHDPLTGLFNRRHFQEELERQVAHAQRTGAHGALMFLDLDGFKYINDGLGHQAGDALLRSVAVLLGQRAGEADVVARLGGDEFAVLLPRVDGQRAYAAATQILDAVRHHIALSGGQPIGVTASIGVALFPEHGRTAEELLAHADVAMYKAKDLGRDGACIYEPDPEWQNQMESKLIWERRIREALEKDLFLLHYQPILDLRTREVSQYELLLRMKDESGEIIPPGVFLGVAERFGLIHVIDRWVVRQAIRLIARHQQEGRELCLAVNLSGKAFADQELLTIIQRELKGTGINPANLVLEITETAAIADFNQASRFIDTLRGAGCQFSIDDFGAGFSSFYYLKHLPVEYVKIDGSFVEHLPHNRADQHLVRAMVELARGLGKKTIAEFVGDEETVRLLTEYGVDCAQGYYLGRPGAFSAVEAETRLSD